MRVCLRCRARARECCSRIGCVCSTAGPEDNPVSPGASSATAAAAATVTGVVNRCPPPTTAAATTTPDRRRTRNNEITRTVSRRRGGTFAHRTAAAHKRKRTGLAHGRARAQTVAAVHFCFPPGDTRDSSLSRATRWPSYRARARCYRLPPHGRQAPACTVFSFFCFVGGAGRSASGAKRGGARQWGTVTGWLPPPPPRARVRYRRPRDVPVCRSGEGKP